MATQRPNTYIDNHDGTLSIVLTQGKVALIDAADYDLVKDYRWYPNRGYALGVQQCVTTRTYKTLHRLIFGNPPSGIDHINHNGLDNRRCNLRLASPLENARNSARINPTSGYRGVRWEKKHNAWAAGIYLNGCYTQIGLYTDVKAAAQAFDAAALEYHQDFACTNASLGLL